ncbi:MAG: hypothetical protein RL410_127 [Actinomycetota bacterium]
MNAAQEWKSHLQEWSIPEDILQQAPESPWIHPPALFDLPQVIEDGPSHRRAREVAPESVLDIGCGGGIAAFALTGTVTSVIGVDHQEEMLTMFAKHAEDRRLHHQEILGDWPNVAEQTPKADVVTCHHVAYNVQEIDPFIKALSYHANKRVVIEIPQRHPLSMSNAAWKHFWGIERPTKPQSEDLALVIKECGFDARFEHWQSPLVRRANMDDEVVFTRIRLCLPSSRDQEIREFLESQSTPQTRAVTTIWWDV